MDCRTQLRPWSEDSQDRKGRSDPEDAFAHCKQEGSQWGSVLPEDSRIKFRAFSEVGGFA